MSFFFSVTYLSIDIVKGNEKLTSNSNPLPRFNIIVNTSGQVCNLLYERAFAFWRQLLQYIWLAPESNSGC